MHNLLTISKILFGNLVYWFLSWIHKIYGSFILTNLLVKNIPGFMISHKKLTLREIESFLSEIIIQ